MADQKQLPVTPISAVAGMVDDSIIYAIRGRIKAVYQKRGGNHDVHGAWSMQNIIIEACDPGDTGECKVCLKNRDEELSRADVGKIMYAECFHGDRGWSGIKAKDEFNRSKNVDEREVRITSTGNVTLSGGNAAPAQQQPNQKPAPAPQKPPPQKQENKQSAQPSGDAPLGANGVLKEASRAGHLLFIQLRAAAYAAKQATMETGVEFNSDNITSMALTLYIDASRKNHQTQLDYKFSATPPDQQ